MGRKKAVADATLTRLWAKAVIAKYKRCPITGERARLQAHHIIYKGRQNRYAVRWDLRNGICLSPEAHRALHDGDIDTQKRLIEYVEERGDKEYLMRQKNKMKPDFLRELGLTDDEYRRKIKAELEEVIKDG
jgi:hypothetical protein